MHTHTTVTAGGFVVCAIRVHCLQPSTYLYPWAHLNTWQFPLKPHIDYTHLAPSYNSHPTLLIIHRGSLDNTRDSTHLVWIKQVPELNRVTSILAVNLLSNKFVVSVIKRYFRFRIVTLFRWRFRFVFLNLFIFLNLGFRIKQRGPSKRLLRVSSRPICSCFGSHAYADSPSLFLVLLCFSLYFIFSHSN